MIRAYRLILALTAAVFANGCAHETGAGPNLSDRIAEIGTRFENSPGGGRVGVAIEDLQSRKRFAFDGRVLYPQQSVSKLWVAVAVLDAVDEGRLRLTDSVIVHKGDMSVFNQPMQKLLGQDDTYTTTIDGLLVWAIAHSDNAANDILMRLAGGPDAVQRLVKARHLGAVRSGPEEKVLQSRIAGVEWKPEYSFGQAFWTARDQIDPAVRKAKLEAYLADPEDGASPLALAAGLARLKRGELLSAASTARLLDILALTDTGPARLKAGLAQGWNIAHKTGTGQDLGDLSTGYNDVGLITAPDGRVFAIAVMIAATRRPIPERQAMMASVSRAVVLAVDPSAKWPEPKPAVTPPATPQARPHTPASNIRR